MQDRAEHLIFRRRSGTGIVISYGLVAIFKTRCSQKVVTLRLSEAACMALSEARKVAD